MLDRLTWVTLEGKTILQLSPSVLLVWQEYEWEGVFVSEPLSFLPLSALCPPTKLSQTQQHLTAQCYAGIKIHLPSRENHLLTTLL